MDNEKIYCIVRMYKDGWPDKRHVFNLTLEEAQAWCRNPNTSSSTATTAAAKRHTEKYGPWFDGYELARK